MMIKGEEAPPPYTPAVDQGVAPRATGEKVQQQYASTSSQPHPALPGPDIHFHVYKAAGMFCKDDIITGENKNEIQYYLEFPIQFFGGWNLTLHRGSREGPRVLTIEKSRFDSNFMFTMANGWTTNLFRSGFFSRSHEFVGFDGRTRMKWKTDGVFSGDWVCMVADTEEVVANWRRTGWAITKDGSLIVKGKFANQVELILGTALAIEEEVPPPYTSGSTASFQDPKLEKYSQTDAPATVFHSSDDDIELHVYKDKYGLSHWNDVVMDSTKTNTEYYLEFPVKWSGKWDMKLHRGDKSGPIIFAIKKGMCCGSKMSFTGTDGFNTDLKKTRWWGQAHEFKTLTGSMYKWKCNGVLSSNWHLLNSSKNDEVVAEWRKTNWAKKKGGVLTIKSNYSKEQDLILATALAMEEWVREQTTTAVIAANSS